MDYQNELQSSLTFKSSIKNTITKVENQNDSQQQLLNQMNVHFNNQPYRKMGFENDILKYFDNEYQFQND